MALDCQPECPTDVGINCDDLGLIRVKIPKYEGEEVGGRMRGVVAPQGQHSTIEFDFLNRDGRPLNLAECESLEINTSSSGSSAVLNDNQLMIRIREAFGLGCRSQIFYAPGTLVPGSTNKVRFAIPEMVLDTPGIFEVNAAVAQGDRVKAIDRFYLHMEPSLFSPTLQTGAKIPTQQEVRLAVRDSSPEDSYLNQALEWTDGEVAQAMITAVRWFNEQRPPIRLTYDTTTFPYHRKWIEGAMAELFRLAAVTYRRENLSYQASGTAINDKNKFNEYEQIAQMREREFKIWARTVRAERNAMLCYGSA